MKSIFWGGKSLSCARSPLNFLLIIHSIIPRRSTVVRAAQACLLFLWSPCQGSNSLYDPILGSAPSPLLTVRKYGFLGLRQTFWREREEKKETESEAGRSRRLASEDGTLRRGARSLSHSAPESFWPAGGATAKLPAALPTKELQPRKEAAARVGSGGPTEALGLKPGARAPCVPQV